MRTSRIFQLALAGLLTHQVVQAQDYHFSLYSEAPSAINPALAGVTYNTRIVANYKTQWASVANKFETMGISFDQTIKHRKLKDNYLAIAANIFRDVSGDAKLTSLNPNLGITYLQKISKRLKFSGGLQGGFMYRTIDDGNLRWDAQYDGYSYNASLPSGETAAKSGVTAFDLGGGINFNFIQSDKFVGGRSGAKFDIGVSGYHYSLGKTSFLNSQERLDTRACFYVNGDFSVPNSINAIAPSLLYMVQGPSREFIAGALFRFIIGDPSTYTALRKPRSISIGGYYRYQDAIIPTMLLQYNAVAIGVAYDINLSGLTPASNRRGGLELMLRYNVAAGYGVNLGRRDTKPSY